MAEQGPQAASDGKPKPGGLREKFAKMPLQGSLGCFPWVVAAIAVAATVYFFNRLNYQGEPPLPEWKPGTVATANFFQAYQESVEFLAKGKGLFFQGRAMLDGNLERLPESASAKSRHASPFFKAAESFAVASERIGHANDLLKTSSTGLKTQERACRDMLAENLEKYMAAVKFFHEYATAQYMGLESKAGTSALKDGNAKWDTADTLMEKFLAEGCRGEYFKYIQGQKHDFRRKAFENYRAFYGDRFEAQRLIFSTLMAYPVSAESLPYDPQDIILDIPHYEVHP